MNDVVATVLLTSQPDPQRGSYLPSNINVVRTLMDSVHRHGHRLVVLHDCLGRNDADHPKVQPGGNPLFYRWSIFADWINDTKPDRVWLVDGTDVEMLHDPFPHMQPGALYIGSEPHTLAIEWLAGNHPSIARFAGTFPYLQLHNCGIVGGYREVVSEFLIDFNMVIDAASSTDLSEMGAFNLVTHTQWAGHVVTGWPVHTEYKAFEHNGTAWWRHK